ncbi:MAG TPA: exo-beta-N-acetylmuramidase NamZ domain-containing protein [Fimbriimonadaceae bacterium]|jgi:uncharacterized protein YbbC (DUF1343 family)/CubicO group peptidase (beta-lactamase class C family)
MKLLACGALLFLSMATLAQTFSGSEALDGAINQAIKDGKTPGAVVLIGHNGHVVYKKAYGERSVMPTHEPMSLDTIFDAASLTKVVATVPCLMKLYDEGKFRLNDLVTEYIPEFQGGHSQITIRDLLTHFSGLRPDLPLEPHWTGYDTAIKMACEDPPQHPPGRQHVYSDINFELLGELVHRLSGQMENDYARENIFEPLGMKDTMYLPPASLLPRIAPTEVNPDTGIPLRGVVHDPTARNMGGVAGHAGAFTTADDLARYAQCFLNEGTLDRVRMFSPLTVEKFTEPQTPTDQPILRGLGWDIDSPYSSNRGELFPIGSYGHTGFTGTSIWIDPTSKTYVILLCNSVHPHERKVGVIALRSKVATIVAASFGIRNQEVTVNGYNETNLNAGRRRTIERNAKTLTGLDVLEAEKFAPLMGKRIGLITNQTGVDRDGKRNIDLMRAAGVNIAALFSPEHGFLGEVDHPNVEDTIDPETGIKVFSLYGKHVGPTPEMLTGIDELVFDIQDVGVHFYTYESTMGHCLKAAGKAGIPFTVLDRPNPITGVRVEGPILDKANVSFVGFFAGMPVRHGMTMGELAQMENGEMGFGAKLDVIKMEDWERGDWFDATSLLWVNPSPNMRSLTAAMLYPGICLLESQKISVGRGTDAPFEQFGADYINGGQLAEDLNRQNIPGIRFYPTKFKPDSSEFAGQWIEGVRLQIVDREKLDATGLGLKIACTLHKLYPGKTDWAKSRLLIGSDDVVRQIEAGRNAESIERSCEQGIRDFLKMRAKYLIYGLPGKTG